MPKFFFLVFLALSLVSCHTSKKATTVSQAKAKVASKLTSLPGFINFSWQEDSGQIWLEIEKLDEEFLYVNSLQAGIGSNDIGLDRGQLGDHRVVKFIKSGPKILLIQPNYKFRAITDNPDERKAVEEAFAQSVLWGFKISRTEKGKYIVDATNFFLRDAHDVVGTLKNRQQGSYKLDKNRSAIYMPSTKNFPKNTEFEAILSFTGKAKGNYIRSVTPSPDAITVRQHHSFVALPDDNYKPRRMDPRSGFFGMEYYDYASPIDGPLIQQFINRHRLAKKDPTAAISEAVEPIIYYLDRGAPEPIRSALLEGASWWNQAFEAAGYKDAFQVKMLPEGVDPMDVRYNLIQWVHRSTRGWSYGGGVFDPRTGEIIKGKVTLGSLRVRQDFLIAQGLLAPYKKGKIVSPEMKEMALARLRQLSAHEVGHTLGLTHNFAASTNNRASVMDYPHPYVTLNTDGSFDFSKAYDDKIGRWDKQAILYGYQDFPKGTDEAAALNKIIQDGIAAGLSFLSDRDARGAGGAHPQAHLWDNGTDAVQELDRLLALRAKGLARFGEENIPMNTPMADLEEVLVPLYLAHRYQIEAVSKLIGGLDYSYANRGDGQKIVELVAAPRQLAAIEALVGTLSADQLAIPERILELIPPKPMGRSRNRESFESYTGLSFDPIGAAASIADKSIAFMLHPERAARLVEQKARKDEMPGLEKLLDYLLEKTWKAPHPKGYHGEIARMVDQRVLQHLFKLANPKHSSQVQAIVWLKISDLRKWIATQTSKTSSVAMLAHFKFAEQLIEQFYDDPTDFKVKTTLKLPAGSPIGMEWHCGDKH
ncbi:MAG: zinc-dependent metalloprotease [Saprospiraceae bacterium]